MVATGSLGNMKPLITYKLADNDSSYIKMVCSLPTA